MRPPSGRSWQQSSSMAANILKMLAFFSCRGAILTPSSLCRRTCDNEDASVSVYELQLQGYRLTTAEILYRLPDHPALLQSFIWQKFDLAPDFPELRKFLEFWSHNIEGKLHSVNVKQSSRTAPNRVRHVNHQLTLHGSTRPIDGFERLSPRAPALPRRPRRGLARH